MCSGGHHIVYTPATDAIDMRDSRNEEVVSGLQVEGSEVLGLAKFADEAVASTIAFKGSDRPAGVLPDNAYQDVKEFFARPRLVTKLTASTSKSGLYSQDVVNPLGFWPAVAQNRLNGILGFRATIKFTLTLAATPFQQGMVTTAFQYGTSSTSVSNPRTQFVALNTNLPHVRLNFNEHTMSTLEVPYVSAFDFIEVANPTATGGDNFLYPYGAISVAQQLPYATLASSTAPIMSLYVSLHDMELYGAVPVVLNAVIPQSGVTIMNKESKNTKGSTSKNLRRVSRVAGTVSKIAGYTGIPFVGGAASTVSWLAEKASGLASAFGYSKPIIEDQVCVNQMNVYGQDSHIDQPDPSQLVSPFQSNRIALDGVNGVTDVDEMSFPFIFSSYNQAFQGTLTTADVDGTFIYATRLCPTNFWFRTNASRPGGNLALPASATAVTNGILPTTLCYVSQMFRYWRGGIRFRFTFAKTNFHAGRLIASFVPGANDTGIESVGNTFCPLPEVINGGIQPFTTSTIFDLKDGNVFDFDVPFVCARNWLSTLGSSGGVSLGVLDQLRTTGETSTTITFLVEVCGADDFEVSNFIGSSMAPANGVGTIVVYQSGLDLDDTPNVASGDTALEISQYTVGEKITSLKELIQLPTVFDNYQATTVTSGTVTQTQLPNWSYGPQITSVNPLPTTTQAVFSTAVGNVVASMYGFMSGGTTYHFYSTAINQRVTVRQNVFDGNSAPSGYSDLRYRTPNSAPRVLTTGATATAIHFKCPSYQKTPIVPRDYFSYFNTNWFLNAVALIRNNIFVNTVYLLSYYNGEAVANPSARVLLSYAASDDARGTFFIGPPPVWLLQSTQSVPIDSEFAGV